MTQPIETSTTIEIKVEEAPIAGVFYIRDKWLLKAKQRNKRIVLHYNNEKYSATYEEWMNGAKKMEKEFLIPGNPMILYGNYLKKYPYREELGEVSAISTFTNMPDKYREQLRIKLGLKK